MGEPALRVIAHELVQVTKFNVSVDWMHRASARANIRRHVKRLLRIFGYPPDLQKTAPFSTPRLCRRNGPSDQPAKR
jgi:type I restriction enzyme R subunit